MSLSFSDVLKLAKPLIPMAESELETLVKAAWPHLDSAIAGISNPEAKVLLQALSPALEAAAIAILKAEAAKLEA